MSKVYDSDEAMQEWHGNLLTEILSELRTISGLLEKKDASQPTYAAWNGTGWMMTHEGEMFKSHDKGVIEAMVLTWHDIDIHARQIGPDGKPVAE